MSDERGTEGEGVVLPKKLDNRWFREAYEAALKFYERDKVLDARDRLDLSNSYASIARYQAASAWAGFGAVFAPPFAIRYYNTGSVKGVKVPRNFMFGIVGMFVASYLAGDWAYKRELNALDPEGKFSGKNSYGDDELNAGDALKVVPREERKYDMMALLKNGGSSKWASYFYTTYLHPEKVFPDPKVKLEQFTGNLPQLSPFMHQRDPMGLHSTATKLGHSKENGRAETGSGAMLNSPGDAWSKVREGNVKKENDADDPLSSSSSWGKIRRENFDEDGRVLDTGADSAEEDIFSSPLSEDKGQQAYSIERPSQDDFDKLLENERHPKD
ncbi:Rci37p KNAG_0C04160 [Huiozyma naganishii CBS 8797]|uniref:Uncharacterized protein n=1 Tax=Huiozyma naganishii (strain ATCC MYA-139 / BCRC 22969 / CBS 8797 / KCTC 17520 / NBRC 10181 / NCYC 3082 / Yp74L-3) TaxID=1071383 RepID=J7RJ35_HUIN7|nr:hypothetical protein KNAG_0C04160 [Kazachstania naganishii CBS 8797]CCK69518.1 hypothetical protein KNAG_0C04160 [Kazachstania naganishii CBS 8797]